MVPGCPERYAKYFEVTSAWVTLLTWWGGAHRTADEDTAIIGYFQNLPEGWVPGGIIILRPGT